LKVFWSREGAEERFVLSFPPCVAPTKVLLVPLSSNPDFKPLVASLTKVLRARGLLTKVDDSSASIGKSIFDLGDTISNSCEGKRYSRNDELGCLLGVTIDFQSVKDGTITLRDRDTTTQVRARQEEIVEAIVRLVEGKESWSEITARLPKFEGQEVE
jgi:glycyl-tRNA synthetase